MNRIAGAFRAARNSSVTRNAGWLMAGELFGLGSQLLMFLFVTHAFENDVYGTFVGVVSLALFASPFSSFGAGYLVVQRVVSKGEALVPAILRAWTTVILGALVVGGALVALRVVVLPQTTTILLLEVLVAELLFNQLVQANRFVAQSIDKLWINPIMTATVGVFRILFSVWYLHINSSPTIEGWGFFYALSVAAGALVGLAIIWTLVGEQIRAHFPSRRDLGEGLAFSVNVSSAMLKGDADKFLLTRMSQEAAAGVYGAGYRILGVAGVPSIALSEATYARFFSASGPRDALALAKKLARVSLVINSVIAVVTLVSASWITGLLGDSYAEAAEVLRWIAFMPLLGAWQLFAGNALSGIGHHRTRLLQTTSSAVLNIVLNLALIPRYSWQGAAVATIITELYLVSLHWRTLWRLAARAEQGTSPMVAATASE
jgi:O-antigen/teichoic acid export membrane protein